MLTARYERITDTRQVSQGLCLFSPFLFVLNPAIILISTGCLLGEHTSTSSCCSPRGLTLNERKSSYRKGKGGRNERSRRSKSESVGCFDFRHFQVNSRDLYVIRYSFVHSCQVQHCIHTHATDLQGFLASMYPMRELCGSKASNKVKAKIKLGKRGINGCAQNQTAFGSVK